MTSSEQENFENPHSTEHARLGTPGNPEADTGTMAVAGHQQQHAGETGALALEPALGQIRVGGFSLQDARLSPPAHASKAELEELRQALNRELDHQKANPPALPRSQIPALPPKPRAREWFALPEDLDGNARREIEDKNNAIAAENQAVERDRNNMAAKKSRQVRLEALHNARALLNEKAAECAWLRLKVALMGGRPGEWDDSVPAAVKEAMAEEVKDRVAVIDARNAEEKKREEARKRAASGTRGSAARRRRQNSPSPSPSDAMDLHEDE